MNLREHILAALTHFVDICFSRQKTRGENYEKDHFGFACDDDVNVVLHSIPFCR